MFTANAEGCQLQGRYDAMQIEARKDFFLGIAICGEPNAQGFIPFEQLRVVVSRDLPEDQTTSSRLERLVSCFAPGLDEDGDVLLGPETVWEHDLMVRPYACEPVYKSKMVSGSHVPAPDTGIVRVIKAHHEQPGFPNTYGYTSLWVNGNPICRFKPQGVKLMVKDGQEVQANDTLAVPAKGCRGLLVAEVQIEDNVREAHGLTFHTEQEAEALKIALDLEDLVEETARRPVMTSGMGVVQLYQFFTLDELLAITLEDDWAYTEHFAKEMLAWVCDGAPVKAGCRGLLVRREAHSTIPELSRMIVECPPEHRVPMALEFIPKDYDIPGVRTGEMITPETVIGWAFEKKDYSWDDLIGRQDYKTGECRPGLFGTPDKIRWWCTLFLRQQMRQVENGFFLPIGLVPPKMRRAADLYADVWVDMFHLRDGIPMTAIKLAYWGEHLGFFLGAGFDCDFEARHRVGRPRRRTTSSHGGRQHAHARS